MQVPLGPLTGHKSFVFVSCVCLLFRLFVSAVVVSVFVLFVFVCGMPVVLDAPPVRDSLTPLLGCGGYMYMHTPVFECVDPEWQSSLWQGFLRQVSL